MMRGNSLNLKYNRNMVLAKVKENRAQHEKDFSAALEVYKKSLIDALSKKLSDAKEGKKIDHHINLTVPVHYLKEYDKAIAMFTDTTQDEIELDQTGYAQLIRDEWAWSKGFETYTKVYNGPVGSANTHPMSFDDTDIIEAYSGS